MRIPVIAIVGRPNVGKSAFFNAVVRSRVSIVDSVAGVTRDRISMEVEYDDRRFELVDTGGIGLFDTTLLKDEIEQQIQVAIASADGVIFMVDVREGMVPLDQEVARRLRQLECPVLLVANKADDLMMEHGRHQFHALGFGDPLATSALAKRSVFEAISLILEKVPPFEDEEISVEKPPRVAIVGKMNAGKSTLVNYLAQEDRVIVSEIPGTTRDSVDVRIEIDGQQLIVIDTAGLRKKQSVQDSVEFYGQARAARAIRRADVILLLVDCTRDISQVDKQLASMITDAYKPCILCITKWDLAGELTPEHYLEYVQSRLGMLNFSPLTFISSKTAFNVRETFSLIPNLWEQANTRVPTAQINKALQEAFTRKAPRTQRSRVPKITFGMQVDVCPPTILVFVNHPKLFNDEYRRYLANRFREALPYSEIPLRIAYRGKESKGLPPGPRSRS